MIKTCNVSGCLRPAGDSRGMCKSHYRRWQRHGDPLGGGTGRGEAAKFMEKAVDFKGDECLIWPFGMNGKGYARICIKGEMKYVHREVCTRVHGQAPSESHEVAHDKNGSPCESRACVNPRHIRWATKSENERDKVLHGTDSRGERGGTAKLVESDVRKIISLRGVISQVKISEVFGISPAQVGRIHLGVAWPHIERESHGL